jgi:hypothetical protein
VQGLGRDVSHGAKARPAPAGGQAAAACGLPAGGAWAARRISCC